MQAWYFCISLHLSRPKISCFYRFWWKVLLSQILMWNLQTPTHPLNLKIYKVVTEKHLCRSLVFNKIAEWNPAATSRRDFGTGHSCELSAISKNAYFAERLRKAVYFVFSRVSLFPIPRVVKKWKPAMQKCFLSHTPNTFSNDILFPHSVNISLLTSWPPFFS